MNTKVIWSMLILCGSFATAQAAEDPANSTLVKQCESATGEVKRECEAVAKKMLQQPTATAERPDKTDQDVTHSSPVMDTEAQERRPATPTKAEKAQQQAERQQQLEKQKEQQRAPK
jgi:hypothetical protein